MVNPTCEKLGSTPSMIRELFAYGLRRSAEVGTENVFDYSLGNPSIPAPQGADWADVSPAEGEAHIRAALAAARNEDYKNYCTTLGPHRDNMEVTIAGISARSFGSQGQQRSCALALKLAQCRVMEETLGEAPIILLDDVLSELDKTRRDYFLHGEHPGQVFITCCENDRLDALLSGRIVNPYYGIGILCNVAFLIS